MIKHCLMACLCFIVSSNIYAQEPLDISELSCNQFIAVVNNINQGDKGQMRVVSLTSFLYGYIAGQNSSAKFNTQELGEVLNALKNTCKSNGQEKIIRALNSAYLEVTSG